MRRDNTCWCDVDVFDEPEDSFCLVSGINDEGFSVRLENVAVSLQPTYYDSVDVKHVSNGYWYQQRVDMYLGIPFLLSLIGSIISSTQACRTVWTMVLRLKKKRGKWFDSRVV